jgi:hypothetical protein
VVIARTRNRQQIALFFHAHLDSFSTKRILRATLLLNSELNLRLFFIACFTLIG